jgi:phosphoserine phosphatase
MNVITILSDLSKHPITKDLINELQDKLDISDIKCLSEDAAYDLYCGTIDGAEEIIQQVISNQPIDYVIQNTENRKKKMLISDMDSTIINQECIDELADFAGLKEKVSNITERAMNGELDFAEALTKRVKLLAGLPISVLEEAYNSKITFTQGAKELVKTMSNNGAYCMLVSGGFQFFTGRVTEDLGFDFHDSNELGVQNKKLTGEVVLPIRDKETKLQRLNEYVSSNNITNNDVLAVGDGANDLPMIKAAGMGVAFHAKPAVQKEVKVKINNTGLRSLLYMQGYTDKEIQND